MEALLIENSKGPMKLSGSVTISGSKNTALPLLFSALLFDKEVQFENVPRLWDIETTLALLGTMGCETHWSKASGKVSVIPSIKQPLASYDLVKKMRAGILALGPLIAKCGEAKVSLPGGCAIGARPVNFHIEALRKLGVSIEVEDGYIKAAVLGKLKGAEIEFPEVTVTGTANLMYVAAVTEGKTILENAAREPEVVSLGEFLQSCGAKISGLGTRTINIEGTRLSQPKTPIRIPADRIEAGTWIAIALSTRSELELNQCDSHKMTSVLTVFREMGAQIVESSDGGTLKILPPEKLKCIEVSTAPYPGFPTDMQAQVLATLCTAEGTSRVTENIFENRFMHVAELRRLGAKIEIDENTAIVKGPSVLKAAPMMATDLRASASLVVAALAATGTTKISRIYHLDRGYQRMDEKLRALGAKISRINEAL